MNRKTDEICTPGRKKRRVGKERVAILLAAIVSFITGFMYAFYDGDTAGGQTGQSATVFATPLKEKVNILVLGADEREADAGRSDTTFVVMLDTVAKKTTMFSIPRDTRIKIDVHGWDKINHAYAFGGSKLAKDSVENLLGIPIDYTVVINFNGFIRMVDALGGVTINVEKRMYYSDPYDDNGGLYIDLNPGVQRLDGKSAIQYVRYRDEEGDIGRVARQQKFLQAVVQEFTKPQMIAKLPDFIKECAQAVKTDMPLREMVKLIPVASDAAKSGLNTEWVSGTPIWIKDVSYWLPDIRELRAKIAQIQGLTVNEGYNQATEQLAYEYEHSVPREIKAAEVPVPPVAQNTLSKKQASGGTKTTVKKAPIAPEKPKNVNNPAKKQAGSKGESKETVPPLPQYNM